MPSKVDTQTSDVEEAQSPVGQGEVGRVGDPSPAARVAIADASLPERRPAIARPRPRRCCWGTTHVRSIAGSTGKWAPRTVNSAPGSRTATRRPPATDAPRRSLAASVEGPRMPLADGRFVRGAERAPHQRETAGVVVQEALVSEAGRAHGLKRRAGRANVWPIEPSFRARGPAAIVRRRELADPMEKRCSCGAAFSSGSGIARGCRGPSPRLRVTVIASRRGRARFFHARSM
jgi:hypothetical protein